MDGNIIKPDFALIGFYQAQYGFDQRGFARAIGANQGIYLALIEFGGNVAQYLQFLKPFLKILNSDHNFNACINGCPSKRFSGVRLGIAFSAFSSKLTIKLLNKSSELGFCSITIAYMLTGWYGISPILSRFRSYPSYLSQKFLEK